MAPRRHIKREVVRLVGSGMEDPDVIAAELGASVNHVRSIMYVCGLGARYGDRIVSAKQRDAKRAALERKRAYYAGIVARIENEIAALEAH